MFRVLIADDEPIERLVVTKKIQANFPDRLEVVTAENGSDAVELFSANTAISRSWTSTCRAWTGWTPPARRTNPATS